MSLVNVAYSAALTWGNPQLKTLEDQALVPMFGDHPLELGLREGDGLLPLLRSDPKYQALFQRAFPDEAARVSWENVTKAIACFERSIISARSPYDRYHYGGQDDAVSDSAKRGEILFFNQQLSCFRFHGGFNFSDATVSENNHAREIEFHNTGLYNIAGALSYPAPDLGALYARWQHSHSRSVIDHYAAGGRTISSGPHAGIGHNNPNKDPLVGGFQLSQQDRADLIAFLESLTDQEVLHDPRFANPW